FIPKSNIVFFDKNFLTSILLSQNSRIEKIEINRDFFLRNVTVSIIERQADYLWCSDSGDCFFMNKNGLVFKRAPFTESEFLLSSVNYLEPKNRIIFRGVLNENPLLENFTSSEQMQKYIEMLSNFKAVDIEIFSISSEAPDKAIANSSLGNVIFNPQEDLVLIAQNVILLVEEIKSKNPEAIFDYIDTRFGNKLFYKLI
ncbi:MAG: hypothetical protein JW740_01770, partial [Candidatus Zambryskibacteria bacterium]|nr:hypothetical protein [Candidatus Zambryskibacteria bacterium]